MAEKVTDQVNGLHFPAGDPVALAQTLQQAAESTDLWARYTGGIPPVYCVEDSVQAIQQLYWRLLREHRPARTGAATKEVSPAELTNGFATTAGTPEALSCPKQGRSGSPV